MDMAKRVVTQTPLTELWNSSGSLDACRGERVGEAEIVELLRTGSTFVVADVGLPLKWVSMDDRFTFWKDQVKHRLVAPDTERFRLDDYLGRYCYVASMWTGASLGRAIVLE